MGSGVQLSTYCTEHECDVCRLMVWSIGVPRGWFQIRRGRDTGQTHLRHGQVSTHSSHTLRTATYFDAERTANGMP